MICMQSVDGFQVSPAQDFMRLNSRTNDLVGQVFKEKLCLLAFIGVHPCLRPAPPKRQRGEQAGVCHRWSKEIVSSFKRAW